MQLYLLRHGSAERIQPGGSDAERKLTAAGREEVRRAIAGSRRAKMAPTLILSSPYARAIETAEIAVQVLGFTGKIVRTEALVPSASPEQVWHEICNRQDEVQVLLAGHEPLLSRLAAYLLNSPSLQIEMSKATLVRIDLDRLASNPHGVLKWMAPTEVWPG